MATGHWLQALTTHIGKLVAETILLVCDPRMLTLQTRPLSLPTVSPPSGPTRIGFCHGDTGPSNTTSRRSPSVFHAIFLTIEIETDIRKSLTPSPIASWAMLAGFSPRNSRPSLVTPQHGLRLWFRLSVLRWKLRSEGLLPRLSGTLMKTLMCFLEKSKH